MPAVETCMHYILYIVIVNIDYCDIFLPDKTAPFLDFLYHLIHDNLFFPVCAMFSGQPGHAQISHGQPGN